MRPLFATRRRRFLARAALYGTALFVGLPLAVLVHGLGDSLESYVHSGAVLNRRGHSVLLLDLRAHGGSEGRHTTLGGREREDVRAAIAAARERGLGRRGFVRLVVDGRRRRAARRGGGGGGARRRGRGAARRPLRARPTRGAGTRRATGTPCSASWRPTASEPSAP